jgi:hypothetical protein
MISAVEYRTRRRANRACNQTSVLSRPQHCLILERSIPGEAREIGVTTYLVGINADTLRDVRVGFRLGLGIGASAEKSICVRDWPSLESGWRYRNMDLDSR